jgi:hypothetical protein
MNMPKFAAALLLILAAGTASPAMAQTSLETYDAVRAGLLAVWNDTPLTLRNVTLTDGDASAYGSYVPAAGSTFKTGDIVHVYAEVIGYGWRKNADATFSTLLDVDLYLKTRSGQIAASEEKFLSTDIRTRTQNLETFLALNATLTDFSPGDYTLEYHVHDKASGKEAQFSVPITLGK